MFVTVLEYPISRLSMYCFYSTGDSMSEAEDHVYYVQRAPITNTETSPLLLWTTTARSRWYPMILSEPAHVCVMSTSSHAHVHRTVRRGAAPKRTYSTCDATAHQTHTQPPLPVTHGITYTGATWGTVGKVVCTNTPVRSFTCIVHITPHMRGNERTHYE